MQAPIPLSHLFLILLPSPRICHLPGHFVLSFSHLGRTTFINSTNVWGAGSVPVCLSDKTEISAVCLPGGGDRQQAVNFPVLEVNVCSRQTQKEIRHARLTGEDGSSCGINWGDDTQSRLEGGEGVDHANVWREKELSGPRPVVQVLVCSSFRGRPAGRRGWNWMTLRESGEDGASKEGGGWPNYTGLPGSGTGAAFSVLCSALLLYVSSYHRKTQDFHAEWNPYSPWTAHFGIHFSLLSSAVVTTQPSEILWFDMDISLLMGTNPLQLRSSLKRFLSTSPCSLAGGGNTRFLSHYRRSVRFKGGFINASGCHSKLSTRNAKKMGDKTFGLGLVKKKKPQTFRDWNRPVRVWQLRLRQAEHLQLF